MQNDATFRGNQSANPNLPFPVPSQAVVHLVCNQEAFNHMMSWGCVEALRALVRVNAAKSPGAAPTPSSNSNNDMALSVTFFSMSTFESVRLPLAEKGLVPSVLDLLTSPDDMVKVSCLATLQNMSLEEKTGDMGTAGKRSPSLYQMIRMIPWRLLDENHRRSAITTKRTLTPLTRVLPVLQWSTSGGSGSSRP
jgi:hypothetical protein